MLIFPKRPGQPLAGTSVPGLHTSRLLHLTDHTNNLTFLVDTGAAISVLPPSPTNRNNPQQDFNLQAVNGSPITTYGKKSLTLNLGLRRSLQWIFVIADVHKPILGADFLHHFNLSVDLKNKTLVDNTTNLSIGGIIIPSTSPQPALPTPRGEDDFTKLLAEFPQLTQTHNYNNCPVRHDVTHTISTSGQPVVAKARRLDLGSTIIHSGGCGFLV